jgi:plasmid maintenance system antidote protein VapI
MANPSNTTNPSDLLEVPHPSHFIAEELKARGWSVNRLAVAMGGDSWNLNRFALDLYFTVGPTNPECRLGAMADDLADAFGVPPEFFHNMEAAWLRYVDQLRAALKDSDHG